jgi:SAM-dependent methyltransferase
MRSNSVRRYKQRCAKVNPVIPKSTPQSWDAAYGHLAPKHRTEFGPGEARAVAILQERVSLGPGVSVVELGGGGGSFLLPFARLGCVCYAVDFSKVGLERAQQLFRDQGHELNVIVGDLMRIGPDLRSRFDIAVSYGLCEHFRGDERLAMIRAHLAVLKSAGVAMFSVPNRLSPAYQLWWRATRTLTRVGMASRLDVNIIDEWAFSPGELAKMCEQAGFDRIAIVGAPVLGDAVDMLARPAWKFIVRLFGGRYERRAFIHAPRLSFDDKIGSYLYAVGSVGPSGD